jgi:hypothetical protein
MKSWNPEAVEAMLASQGIRLAPGRAAKIAAALNTSAGLEDPLLGSLEFETDPTTYTLIVGQLRSK